MKSTISKQTVAYINRLEQEEGMGIEASPYHSHPDAIDQLIIENGLRIAAISFYPSLDLMLIVLNNKRVIKRNISDFNRLHQATQPQLENYEISPMGVHWPELDEDLSLRGFLKHELAFMEHSRIV